MTTTYLSILFTVFILITVVEMLVPLVSERTANKPSQPEPINGLTKRWMTNITIFIINSYVSKFITLFLGLWVAIESGYNSLLPIEKIPYIPQVIQVLIGLFILDLGHYFSHRIQHKFSFFWRFHQVHHSQRHLDLSSGWLFHPVEAMFSSVLSVLLIYTFGIQSETLLVFFILVTIFNMLEHGNFHLPYKIDRVFACVFITPGLHRAHHSLSKDEFDLNFSVLFSFWDRLFGTFGYAKNELKMPVEYGIKELSGASTENIKTLLLLPFYRHKAEKGASRKELGDK